MTARLKENRKETNTMSDEEPLHPLDRPPTKRKYRRVGEEEQDGKSSNVATSKVGLLRFLDWVVEAVLWLTCV